MSIQAVFWDYDNTILETADAHWNKHQTVLARYGTQLDDLFRQKIYENNSDQNWEWMESELGLTMPKTVYLNEIDQEFQSYMSELSMRSGVGELFKEIDLLGIPQAIVTNARKESAEPILDAKKITPLMKFVLCKEDYEGRKPSPTPYLCALEKMAKVLNETIDPKRCIAIEDDPKGVESAHRAGLIVVHRKLKEEEPNSPYADYCCFHSDDFLKTMSYLLKAYTERDSRIGLQMRRRPKF